MSDMSYDWYSETARQKFSLPLDWRWARAEAITGGILLEGSKTSLNKKGKTKWEKPYQKIILTNDDIKECEKKYEINTGGCSDCRGSGKFCYGWDHEKGKLYKPCEKCNGSGKSK